MWRRLVEDHRGSGDMVEDAGIEVLREYTRLAQRSPKSRLTWTLGKKAVRHLWIRAYEVSKNAQVHVPQYHSEGTQDRDCKRTQGGSRRLHATHGMVPSSVHNPPARDSRTGHKTCS